MLQATPRTRVGLVIVLVAISSSLLLAARILWSGPTLAQAERAYQRGDWAGTVAIADDLLRREPDDEKALRLEGRALARLGRTREAVAVDAKLGGGRLQAEDLFLAGQALKTEGRTALGWAAIDAASRLDPRHAGAADALAGRPKAGPGGIGRADRLASIPDPSALAEMVVGLATLEEARSPTGGNPDRLLERATFLDRRSFLKLESPAASRKFLARLLLEEARPREARDYLATVGDPEANWLLSRAYLAEGNAEKAAVSLGRAGSFGRDDPMTAEPSPYAGAKSCAGCHKAIYDSQQSSHHAGTIARGDGLKSVPLPDGSVVDPENPAVTHRFDRGEKGLEISTDPGSGPLAAIIDYAIGSGNHGVTMLAREPDGRHRSLRLSYYSRGRHWGLTSGFEPRPDDPRQYLGEILNDNSFRNCVNCHSTRFTSETDRGSPETADRGIGCERCHGPGEFHVKAVESSFDQLAIARPKLATPSRRLNLCAQCHGSDGVIPPADPRFIRFVATTLPYSRCVSESGGRLDCVACHDPHRNLETDPAYYEARCVACHGQGTEVRKPGPGFRLEAVASSRCKANHSTGCVTCHMPKVEGVLPFMTFTDHHIRSHRPAPGTEPARDSR